MQTFFQTFKLISSASILCATHDKQLLMWVKQEECLTNIYTSTHYRLIVYS